MHVNVLSIFVHIFKSDLIVLSGPTQSWFGSRMDEDEELAAELRKLELDVGTPAAVDPEFAKMVRQSS